MVHGTNVNYANAIHKLRKVVSSESNLQRSAVDSISGFLDQVCESLVSRARELQRQSGRLTTDAKTIQTAVKLTLSSELATMAISEGTKAILKYKETVQNQPKSEDKDSKTPRQTNAMKSGLIFPVSKASRCLKFFSKRVSPEASIYLTAVLQYIANEILTVAEEITSLHKRKQITVDDVHHAVFGRPIHIHASLLPKKSKKQSENEEKQPDPSNISGDSELEALARRVHWGSMKRGYKGIYTKPHTKRRKVVPENVESDRPATGVGKT